MYLKKLNFEIAQYLWNILIHVIEITIYDTFRQDILLILLFFFTNVDKIIETRIK